LFFTAREEQGSWLFYPISRFLQLHLNPTRGEEAPLFGNRANPGESTFLLRATIEKGYAFHTI
jgi:hypothetical protein